MYGEDFNNQLGEYLLDEGRKINKVHLDSICKIGQKENTCRYISLSKIGYICMKKSPAKNKLDEMAAEGDMAARSDNCEGLGVMHDKS